MYDKSKKLIAVFLVVAMLCTLLPVSAFADSGTSAVHTHADEYDETDQPRVFDKVFDPELTVREAVDGDTTYEVVSASVKTGSYYLDCDYGVNQDNLLINIEGTVHLCLNGYELHAGHINVLPNAKLYIYDCETREATHTFNVNGDGLWEKDANGAKTVTGGMITCMVLVCPTMEDGDSAGEFYLCDGTIVGVRGIALFNFGVTYIYKNGAIIGNYSDKNYRCVVANLGDCFVNSGTITENTSMVTVMHSNEENESLPFTNYGKIINNNGAGIYITSGSMIVGGYSNVTGNTVPDNTSANIVLAEDTVIQFDENIKLIPGDACMGVRSVITSAAYISESISNSGYTAEAIEQFFFADNEAQAIHCDGDMLALFDKFAPEAVTGETDVAVLDDGIYFLDSDYTTEQSLWIEGDVTICLNGHELHAKEIVVQENATFYVSDCQDTRHYFNVTDSGLWVEVDKQTDNTQTIYGGIITSPVVVMPAESESTTAGTFILIAGTIVGVEGTAVMNKGYTQLYSYGWITGNYSGNSGYVIYNEGTFKNSTGIIMENTAKIAPIYNNAYFANGSVISSNKSLGTETIAAGAVYNTGKNAELMNLGYIHHNSVAGTPSKAASGIYNDNGAKLSNWSDVRNNTAVTAASGIYMESGTLEAAVYSNVTGNTGNGAANNIYLGEGVEITFFNDDMKYFYDGALMGIQSATSGAVVMRGCQSNPSAYFYADKSTQGIHFDGGTATLVDVGEVEITLSGAPFVYTGAAITPEVSEVKIDNNTISADGYRVSYANNINADTALVNVTFLNGAYKDVTVGKLFTIEQATLESLSFDIAAPQGGAQPADEAANLMVNGVACDYDAELFWYERNAGEDIQLTDTDTFEAGKQYVVYADIQLDNYSFPQNLEGLTVKVNGETVPVTALSEGYQSLEVEFVFGECPKTVIDSIAFNIAAPKAGAAPAVDVTLLDGDGLTLDTSTPFWSDADDLDAGDITVFEAGKRYVVAVDFYIDMDNYEPAESITATVNGVSFTDCELLEEKGYAVGINPYRDSLFVWFDFDRIPYPYYGGSTSSNTTITVPTEGSGAAVQVEVSVSGATADVKIDSDALSDVLQTGTDTVEIDLSGLDHAVDSAKIPMEALETIAEADSGSEQATAGITIKFATASVSFDNKAVKAITEQANGNAVQISVERAGTSRLNQVQKEKIKDLNVVAGYEAYVTSNGKRISDFKGGSAKLQLPKSVVEGKDVRGFSVWYIAEDGSREKLQTRIVNGTLEFTVPHFSDYIVTYDENDIRANSVNDSYKDCLHDSTCPASKYSDADAAAWYHDGVHFCIDNGILTGFPDGTFQPDTATSRAMIAAMLWRLEGSPVVNDAMNYRDVNDGDWYAEAVRWAAANRVASGYGNGVFGPNDAITREQLAAMLHNYAVYKGFDVSVGENTNILSYDDAFDISDWAYPAMQWACGSGMINGVAKGLLAPTATATRAQTAVMIKHFVEHNELILP